ncbi:hypothetical protein J7T55_006146 [Diaporthe amygdali]|uniref:uncharacterized protein n=1 Tax=Phomopsis amygdali TaxID=1214568 RepID=UPI0022FE2DE8|nr:uncharacterized protein J7T55_006146 [Diaporthe amygdali]KAJ0124805.1 hypothetical protein J7T55_006146 [Diaporthe amygdali]
MGVPRRADSFGNYPSRARILMDLTTAESASVQGIAFRILRTANESNSAVLDAALDDPHRFIENIRDSVNLASAEQAAPQPHSRSSDGDQPTESSRTEILMRLLRSEPTDIRDLAHVVLLSAHNSYGPHSRVEMALDNPEEFILEMRTLAHFDEHSGEGRANDDLLQPMSQSPMGEPGASHGADIPETPRELDPEIFNSLPEDIRAEFLVSRPSQSSRPSSTTNEVPAAVETLSSGDTVEEVSWARISEWLQSRTVQSESLLFSSHVRILSDDAAFKTLWHYMGTRPDSASEVQNESEDVKVTNIEVSRYY